MVRYLVADYGDDTGAVLKLFLKAYQFLMCENLFLMFNVLF